MLYSSMGIVAIIINMIINRDVLKKKADTVDSRVGKAYRLFLYAMLAYHVTDALWGIIDMTNSQVLLYLDTIIYYIAMYLAVLYWARYVVCYLDDHSDFAKKLLRTGKILMLMELIALVVNHFVHFFFWVDESGDYHAYTFRYVALAIQVVLFFATSCYAYSQKKKTDDTTLRNRYSAIASFGIAMDAAIIIQSFYPLLPIYSIGYMIGTCIIHSYVIEDENEELRRRANQANDAKTSFLFNMSHDIRTPMNAILGYADIGMRHSEDAEVVSGNLKKIKTAGTHLLNLINDILEMSRIESGNLELAENPIDIRAAIAGVEEMSNSLAAARSIDFMVVVGDITDPYIYSDELHINEVLINLISNAIKYTQPGGKVCYKAEQITAVRDGKADYRFTISDNGIGMSDEFQTHLFEAFSRENSSTVAKTEGVGLGLSIVKKIVDIAGGSISAKSALGEGSEFTVVLPFKVMEKDAAEKFAAENETSYVIKENKALEGRKVLLVEDNEMNREIADDILSEAGLIVEMAEDGMIAVDTLKEKGSDYYDFILMDIQMPVMNGYEATKTIRKLHGFETVPIIALSANAFDEDKKKSMEAGMNDHISKPIIVKDLFEAISNIIR